MAHSPTRPPPLNPEPLDADACSGTDVARLGASTDHASPLVHAERDATMDLDQEAYILRLPVEVLTMIVELAVFGSQKPIKNSYGIDKSCTECDLACNIANAKATCLVSRMFRDVAQPVLFRVIDVRSTKAASRIRHTLSKNVHLRKHCRQLSIVHAEMLSKKFFSRCKDILGWSVNVQCLQIYVEGVTKKMCRHLAQDLATHAQQLKHLLISGDYCHSNFVHIVNNVEFPRLTKLNINCLGCDD
jgi:hypothetical protein